MNIDQNQGRYRSCVADQCARTVHAGAGAAGGVLARGGAGRRGRMRCAAAGGGRRGGRRRWRRCKTRRAGRIQKGGRSSPGAWLCICSIFSENLPGDMLTLAFLVYQCMSAARQTRCLLRRPAAAALLPENIITNPTSRGQRGCRRRPRLWAPSPAQSSVTVSCCCIVLCSHL